MKQHYEIAIIGAGPAGMAAAIEASHGGARTAVFDEQASPGGQIYRAGNQFTDSNRHFLGKDYAYGSSLIEQFRRCNVDYFHSSTIWQVTNDLEIGVSKDGKSRLIKADNVIMATGAIERPFPIPGWTLPGVATVGSAQILLKTAGVVEDNAILVGTGPLLYLLAVQYLRAGVEIRAILDTNPRRNKWKALKYLPGASARLHLILKGQKWISEIKKARVPWYREVTHVSLYGKEKLESVIFKTDKYEKKLANVQKAFLHHGVTPNINLPMAAGCEHSWDPLQLCWKPITSKEGETSIKGIWVAGDGGGIIGAHASEASGHVIARAILSCLGKEQNLSKNERWNKTLSKEVAFRPFIDALFQPKKNFRIPNQNGTIVCRCEEVTVGEIKKNISLGCIGPNQLKAFCRSGMGACQGRLCGLTVSEIIADERKLPVSQIGHYRLRPPIKPLMLGELASLIEVNKYRN